MGKTVRIVTRETGMALAVLALYVFTLLLPLHQAAGLQRDLDALGFATLDTWSVCTQLAVDDDGDPAEAAALNCPALGVAKQQMAAVLPPTIVLPPLPVEVAIPYQPSAAARATAPPDHTGQSRAPPVAV